jgi:hypothetical protein
MWRPWDTTSPTMGVCPSSQWPGGLGSGLPLRPNRRMMTLRRSQTAAASTALVTTPEGDARRSCASASMAGSGKCSGAC